MSAWNITAKDLYLLLRDRRTFAVLLLLPLVFIMIIGLTTGKLLGWQSTNQKLKIVAVDATDYEAIGSRAFMAPLDGEEGAAATEPLPPADREAERRIAGHIVANVLNGIQKAPGIDVRTPSDLKSQLDLSASGSDEEQAAEALVADGTVNAALIFRPDFYRRVYHSDLTGLAARDNDKPLPAEKLKAMGIDLVAEHPDSSTASAIGAVIGYQMLDVILPIQGCRSERLQSLTLAERNSPRYRRLCGPVNAMQSSPPDKLLPPQKEGAAVSNSVYEELVPSYTVMFVFFLVNIMARSFLSERELGTMRRLRIAPVPVWAILVGKTVPFLIVSLIQTAVLFIAGRLLFGMSWGADPWMLLPVIFATSCAATGLGLMIATLVKSDAQVSAYATTAVIILAGISGCFMPRKWLPDLMQQISLATPHAWALIAYDQLLGTTAPNLATVWQCVGMLLAFAAGFFVVGSVRFGSVD
ncbi:MAG: ABC transporter permease [Planctomycetaceae bacterium]|nr:ABC transporter permease [Planctomycetaceae bacterium]